MKELFFYEAHRCIKSKGFMLSVLLGTAIAVMHHWILRKPILPEWQTDYLYAFYPISFYSQWLGGERATSIGSYAPVFILLLACLPFSASLNNDYSSGIVNNLSVSVSPTQYLAAKSAVTFLAGAFSGVLPYMVSMILNLCSYPLIPLDAAYPSSFMAPGILFYHVWCTHPFLYCLLYMFLISLYTGSVALFGMAMGRIVNRAYVIILLPMILIVAISNLLQIAGLSAFIPISAFSPVQIFFSTYWTIPLWLVGLSSVSYALLKRKVIDSDAL